MTALDFYAPDDMDDFDQYEFEDGFDEWDEMDDFDEFSFGDIWKKAKPWASTALGAAQTAYGSPATKSWRKKNKGKDAVMRSLFGALKGVTGSSWFKDGFDTDPYEPEYTTDEIDGMEALAEDALDGDATDSSLAADEMVSRSFGVMRGSSQVRPIMAALSKQLRTIMMRARRDPRMRTMARVAPLALRRTAATLMRLTAARRPISPALGMKIFGAAMSGLMRSPQLRSTALQRARMRSRRHQSRGGQSSPYRNFGRVPGRTRQNPRQSHWRSQSGYGGPMAHSQYS